MYGTEAAPLSSALVDGSLPRPAITVLRLISIDHWQSSAMDQPKRLAPHTFSATPQTVVTRGTERKHFQDCLMVYFTRN